MLKVLDEKEVERLRTSEALHRLISNNDWGALNAKLQQELTDIVENMLDEKTTSQQYEKLKSAYWALKGFFAKTAKEATYWEAKQRERFIKAEQPEAIVRGMRPEWQSLKTLNLPTQKLRKKHQ